MRFTLISCVSDNAIYEFSRKAVENGLDIFRVFDSLNYFGKWAELWNGTYSDPSLRECKEGLNRRSVSILKFVSR